MRFASPLLLLTLVLACFAWAAEPGTDDTALVQRIQETLRIPAGYTVRLGPPEPSEVVGLVKRQMEVSDGKNTRRQVIYLSADGRYLFTGRVFDLSAEPAAIKIEKITLGDNPHLGPDDAKVTIIEYGDFQCPYCERAYWTIKYKVLRRYGDRVRLVYKDFPLADIHPWAVEAAVAGQCAYGQSNEGFWQMHDFFYENQDELTAENLAGKVREFAGSLRMDMEGFERCLGSPDARARVEASAAEARGLGLTGTPAFVIGKEIIRGAAPFSVFRAAIEKELTAQGARNSSR